MAIATAAAEDVAAAVESLGPAYKEYAKRVIEKGTDGSLIHDVLEYPIADDPWDLDRLMMVELDVSIHFHRFKIIRLFNDVYYQEEKAVRDFHMLLDVFRDSMPPVLAASSALVVFGRCRVPAHVVQRRALLGTLLCQRSTLRVSLRRKLTLGTERLRLLCCGCPLSALLLSLATVVDHSGRTSIQHMHVVCIMKRYLSGVARRLWSECMQ